MDDLVIGIDLGTTNCCAAYYINGKVKILENNENQRTTPSFVFFMKDIQDVVGDYAKKMAAFAPEKGVYEVKRLIGKKFDDPHVQHNLKYFPFKVDKDILKNPVIIIEHKDQTLKKSPEEICALILKNIKNNAEAKLKRTVEKAVITVPAYFNVSQKKATLAAGKQAGFTFLKLLSEPTAAALSYYSENDRENEHCLVYDLGGGTFDVSILRMNKGNVDVLSIDGDTNLGGHDIDNLIFDYVCAILIEKYELDPTSDRRLLRRIQNQSEEAKRRLSTMDQTEITLEGFSRTHRTIEIPLTRAQFEEMAEKLFVRTITIIDSCLKCTNLSKDDIKEVILAGGSSRIPKIQEMLSTYFDGKTVNKFVNPDECVAEGAAIHAAKFSLNPKQHIKSIKICDVVALSLGIADFVDRMTFVIKRNTPIPTKQSITHYTVHNQQEAAHFDVYEGERLNVKQNRHLGRLLISNITPAPPRQCKLFLTMIIDENGILTVEAKEEHQNNVKQLKIEYSKDIKDDSEIRRTLEDAQNYQEEDENFQKFASLKEYLLIYCEVAIFNFEKKGLTGSYYEIYELCRRTKTSGKNLDVHEENKMKDMLKLIKERCEPIVKKYNFELMPRQI